MICMLSILKKRIAIVYRSWQKFKHLGTKGKNRDKFFVDNPFLKFYIIEWDISEYRLLSNIPIIEWDIIEYRRLSNIPIIEWDIIEYRLYKNSNSFLIFFLLYSIKCTYLHPSEVHAWKKDSIY